jgi:hypothetical protein
MVSVGVCDVSGLRTFSSILNLIKNEKFATLIDSLGVSCCKFHFGHNTFHKFIEQGYRESRIAVIGTPHHSLSDQAAPHGAK